ncbi:low affinity immunoglobulin gamma Fc region receptor II-like [Sander lucioperca]|uniref:low affinity immunoglobulin gamma Fc region receptor II-like n=1 Tax=Sander lucioperca TaxID=283035 RepID=UPI00125E0F97|nr:low affinity immunoglobulin gamma Fc region receptor II-like [Sander lucioperca]
MEVTAFCIPMLMNALMLLVAHIQHGYPQTPVSDAAFRIVPTRLQLFEYGSVHFTCEGFNVSAGCRVRTIKEFIPKCSNDTVTSTVTCTIDFAFPSDSGEYWCESGGGKRSNTVNITVTAGSVILESPALPVMEGEAVTLSCRTKLTSFSSLITNFYKDGRLIRSSPTGNLTIESVFKSHDGHYKCNIPGAGESPESQLAVKGANVIMESPALPVTEREAVTLQCQMKEAPSDLTADFYKDGLIIGSSSTGEMTIQSVSKSDEGLYKCRISGAGESAERRLTVREEKYDGSVTQSEDSQRADRTAMVSHHYYILLWTVVAVVLFLQLLVIGLLYWKKQLVLLEVKLSDPNKDLYAVVKKDKKKKKDAADNLSLHTNRSKEPQTEKDEDEPLPLSFHSTFTGDDTSPGLQNEPGVFSFTLTAASSAVTDPPFTDQESEYDFIQTTEEITEEETPC